MHFLSMYIILLISGMLQGATVSLNAQLGTYYSMLGVSFFSHVIPMLLMLLYLLVIKRERFRIAGAPAYVYCVGIMGIALTVVTAQCTIQLGATVNTVLLTAGQIVTSATIDHFGLFGMRKAKLSVKQLPGYLLLVVGVSLVI